MALTFTEMGKVAGAGLGRKISILGNVKFGMLLDFQVRILSRYSKK